MTSHLLPSQFADETALSQCHHQGIERRGTVPAGVDGDRDRSFWNAKWHFPELVLLALANGDSRIRRILPFPRSTFHARARDGERAFSIERRELGASARVEEGSAAIGSLTIAPSTALLQQDYPALRARMQSDPCPQADWMTMGAIRNNDDALFVWTGEPGQGLQGLTLPEELASWLRATGIYGKVSNEANWATTAGWPHASDQLLFGGQDVALLLNTNAFIGGTARALRNSNSPGNAPAPPPTDNPVGLDDRFILNQFPNHYVMLLNSPTTNYDPADADRGSAWLSIWTWGLSLSYEVPVSAFVDNYYGAVIATLP